MWILVYFFAIFSIVILVCGFFLDLTVRNMEKRQGKDAETPKIGALLLIFLLAFGIFIGAGSGIFHELKNIRFVELGKRYPIKNLVSSPESYIGKDVKTGGRFFFLSEWRESLYIWDGENEIELLYSGLSEEKVGEILNSNLENTDIKVFGKVHVYSNNLYPFIEVRKIRIKDLDIPSVELRALNEIPDKYFDKDVRVEGDISRYDGVRIYLSSQGKYEIPVAFEKLPLIYMDYLIEGEKVEIVANVSRDRSGYYLQLINISFQ